MNPNLQTPQPEQQSTDLSLGGMQAQAQPQPTVEAQPQAEYQQPEAQPVAPVAPVVPIAQPMAQPTMAQPDYNYNQPSAGKASGLMAILNDKAGLLSLAVFMVMFLILSIATVIDVNHLLSTAKAQYVQYGLDSSAVPSLLETIKETIKHWVFVNPISAWWWALGLAPALGLAGFGLYKSKLKNIPAMVTIILVIEVYINLMVK